MSLHSFAHSLTRSSAFDFYLSSVSCRLFYPLDSGHYFRCLELEYYRSHRGAFEFLLQLILCLTLTLFTSYFIWNEIQFGGPILLFYVLTIYARRDGHTPASVFGITIGRRWLPYVYLFLLYVVQTNWTLALLGILFGHLTSIVIDFLSERTSIRLPTSLFVWGESLKLGDAHQPWQVDRRQTGNRLGGSETMRWTPNNGQTS